MLDDMKYICVKPGIATFDNSLTILGMVNMKCYLVHMRLPPEVIHFSYPYIFETEYVLTIISRLLKSFEAQSSILSSE